MKKINKVFAVLAVVCGVLMMSSCVFNDPFADTYNTWYKYNSTVDVPTGTDGSENDTSSGSLKGAEVYIYYDSDNSKLILAIQKVTTETVDVAGGLLSSDVEITTGGVKEYQKTKATWATIKGFGAWTRVSEPPKIYSKPGECINFTDALNNGIQWKKMLKKLLVNKLLGDV